MALIQVTDDEGVRSVTLSRVPDNALDAAMVAAIEAAVAVPPSISVIVLAGSREVFSRGASSDVLAKLWGGDIRPGELELPATLLAVEVPVIAAMEGHAIGGGLMLGLCADVILLARESRYGTTFMNHGFTPGMGATRLLEKVMSPAMAHELLFGGEPRRGVELQGAGFNHVLPRAEVLPRAHEVARRFADKPRAALTMLKRTLAAPWLRAFREAHAAEAQMHSACFEESRGKTRGKDPHA